MAHLSTVSHVSSALMRGVGVVSLASSAWLTGVIPSGSGYADAPLSWSSAAFAQSAAKIRNYAGAVLEIEPLRKRAYDNVRRMMKGNIPNDVCRQGQIPSSVQSICADFLDESASIIRRNNLSITEFNDLTQRSQSDANLMNLIQQELIRQQRR